MYRVVNGLRHFTRDVVFDIYRGLGHRGTRRSSGTGNLNMYSTVSTVSTVSIVSTVSTVGAVSTVSTVITVSTVSTVCKVSTVSTVSPFSPVSWTVCIVGKFTLTK